MKFPFRLLRELAGHNLCFFGLHAWKWTERVWRDRLGTYSGTESYQQCKRCRTINLKTKETYY